MDASRIVHGVSKLTSGVRYSLYLLNDPTSTQECILPQEIVKYYETNHAVANVTSLPMNHGTTSRDDYVAASGMMTHS